MIRIDTVATRTGDDGSTALADGQRIRKDHPLISALGSIDEANSLLGVVAQVAVPEVVTTGLAVIQNDLFDLGGDLATPPGGPYEDKIPRITVAQVARLDAWLSAAAAQVLPLRSFIIPGGSPAAAWLHLARTVVRRAERELVAAQHADPGRAWNPQVLHYLNRLSDLCFSWARLANDDGRADVLWHPGGGRG